MGESFWGALAGAFVALLGVLIALRSNENIFLANIREDRKKAREEREFNAKHTALIAASEAISRFISYYHALPDRGLPRPGSEEPVITDLTIALNKLHFYCGFETIEMSTRLSKVLNKLFLEAIIAKIPSVFIETEINSKDDEIKMLEKENLYLLDEISFLRQSYKNSDIEFQHREQIAKNSSHIADLYGEKAELYKQKYSVTEKCRIETTKNLRPIHEASRDLLLSARRELSFPINEGEYIRIMNASLDEAVKNIDGLFSEIRNQVEEKMK